MKQIMIKKFTLISVLFLLVIMFTFFSYAATTITLTKIVISPANLTIVGLNQESRTLITTAYYSNGSTVDITNNASYSSSNSTVAFINQDINGNKYFMSGTKTGTAYITASFNGKTSRATVVVNPKLIGITITPTASTITGNNKLGNYVAVMANYDGRTPVTVTSSTTFSSSDSSIVTVTSSRLMSGAKSGTAFITASYKSFTATCKVTVVPTLTKITFEPAVATIVNQNVKGEKVKITALYSDNTTVDVSENAAYKSNNSAIAFIEGGFITSGAKSGKAVITATYGAKTATCTVTVIPVLQKITVTPTATTISGPNIIGSSIKVVGTYSDAIARDVTSGSVFTSNDVNIAYVANKKIVSGAKSGTTTINVVYNDKTASVIVTAKMGLLSISLSPNSSRIVGQNKSGQALTVTGYYSDGTSKKITSSITYTSSDSNVAIVKSNILVSASNPGKAVITAKYSTKTATCEVDVKPSVLNLRVSPSVYTIIGKNSTGKELMVQAVYTDGRTEDVTEWAVFNSNNTDVAIVKGNVLSSSNSYGSAKIIALYGGKTAECLVSIPAPPTEKKEVNIVPREVEKKHGKVTNLSVSHSSSNIYSKYSAGGYISVVSSFSDGFSLDISPKVMFNTSDGEIAYVTKDSNGNRIIMSGSKTGTAVITAMYGGKIYSFTVTVTDY